MEFELTTFGEVHLDIQDIQRSVAFWRDIVGLQQIGVTNGISNLGIDSRTLLVLHWSAIRLTKVWSYRHERTD